MESYGVSADYHFNRRLYPVFTGGLVNDVIKLPANYGAKKFKYISQSCYFLAWYFLST
jgi:hypothetical protein